MDLRELAIDLFKIKLANDVILTNNGLLAWNAPSIARLCFLVRLNEPLSSVELKRLSGTIPELFLENISYVLSNFNGFDFLNSIFTTYGIVSGLLERGDLLDIQNVPFDILSLNGYNKPNFTPQDVFLFSTIGDGLEDFIDGFDAQGNIVTGRFSYSSEILFQWSDYEAWFRNRFELAIEMFRSRHDGLPHPFDIVN